MSEYQQEQHEAPVASSVKVSRNSKKEPQWEVRVREGAEESEIERIRDMAIRTYRYLEEQLPA